jgi:hypothetical protein
LNHFVAKKSISAATLTLTVCSGIKNSKELQEKIFEVVKKYQWQEIDQLRNLFKGNEILQEQINHLVANVDN